MISQNLVVSTGLVSPVLATIASPSTRHLLSAYYNSSIVAAASCYIIGFAIVAVLLVLLSGGEWRHGGAHGLLNHSDMILEKSKVINSIDSYNANFADIDSRNTISKKPKNANDKSANGMSSHEQKYTQRQTNYMNMVNNFYDLVTDFYEYGWGDCFHFGFRFAGEGFQESLRRTEYYLASRIGMRPKDHVIDIGCGVGGPMRNIARFTGSKITGLNNNVYQIKVGTKHNIENHLDKQCDYLQSDFMKIAVPDNHYDHAYAIEATCHAPDKVGCYSEVLRIIKPGGYFGAYEWCITDKFDAKNSEHVAIREGVETGNSLPKLATFDEVTSALRQAGFEVVDSFNAQSKAHLNSSQVPWYQTLAGQYTREGFRMTYVGRSVTHYLVKFLEAIRIAPNGSSKVSALLNDTAFDLVEGGKREIFTPSFFVLARKPLTSNKK